MAHFFTQKFPIYIFRFKAFFFSKSLVLCAIYVLVGHFLWAQNEPRDPNFGKRESALAKGDVYKFALKETGVFKLDYNFLKNDLKINNLDQIDPRNIQLFGNGGGMLPESNSVIRYDDLAENAIVIQGEDDGKFDPSDFILFYGVSADRWFFDTTSRSFDRPKNIYANESFYYVKVGETKKGLRVFNQNNIINTAYTTNSFTDRARFEEDKINLLASTECNCTQGSGKLWLGDIFTSNQKERNYGDKFSFPNIITTEKAAAKIKFLGRSVGESSTVYATVSGAEGEAYLNSVLSREEENAVASDVSFDVPFTPIAETFEAKVRYPIEGKNRGWLDFIQITARRRLQMVGSQMAFRDEKSLDVKSATYQLSNANGNLSVWDITNAQTPKNQQVTLTGSQIEFGVAQNTEGVKRLSEFVAFDRNAALLRPATAIGKVQNQNLHGIDNVDLLIVYHKNFEKAALDLAEHRRKVSGLSVATADIEQVYQEFSSGALDPTAIRDFARLLYKRNEKFKYLLLVGDGAFDYKKLVNIGGLLPSDFIPSYQTDYSLDGIEAYPSDDFFGLLSDTEGSGLNGFLDIGVGRLPVKTASEANAVVRKIIHYDNPKVLGDWRNRAVFLADDQDGNQHFASAESVANTVFNVDKNLNIDKLYVDAFPQIVSAGGTRVPALNEALDQNLFKGALTMCYLGHGSPRRLAQEAVVTREDISTWQNFDRLPIFITATCSFTAFDNTKEESAGEKALLNPNGGAVALLTTVRPVYEQENTRLTRAVFDTIFKKQNGRAQTLGSVIKNAKNVVGSSNSRKFLLIGDPSTTVALPKYNVATTKINGKNTSQKADTMRALQNVTVAGTVTDENGQILRGFNGTLYPTVFDKAIKLRTLGQDKESYADEFSVQRNILFKGQASIKNGEWTFNFTVPKDIDYSFANGKISYYAKDSVTDGTGNFDGFIIGGTDPSVSGDNQPPVVQVFMNDDKFVSGGTTTPSPILFVKVSDDKGINVAGTSVGHDLTGVLDDARDPFVLNNFFQTLKDQPLKGEARYPLSNLSEGRHKIRVKAWDVANNVGEGEVEFIVSASAQAALRNLLNFPNPFTDRTRFQFDHELSGQQINVRIEIFDIQGKTVKLIEQEVFASGNRLSEVEWDGKGSDGTQLSKGVYIYRVNLTGRDGAGKSLTTESQIAKLVLIK